MRNIYFMEGELEPDTDPAPEYTEQDLQAYLQAFVLTYQDLMSELDAKDEEIAGVLAGLKAASEAHEAFEGSDLLLRKAAAAIIKNVNDSPELGRLISEASRYDQLNTLWAARFLETGSLPAGEGAILAKTVSETLFYLENIS